MGVNYKPLWKKLIDLEIPKKQLAQMAGISVSTIVKMGRNEYVALQVLERICKALNCEITDIVEFTEDKEIE